MGLLASHQTTATSNFPIFRQYVSHKKQLHLLAWFLTRLQINYWELGGFCLERIGKPVAHHQ
jgi:hypothetical protein